MNCSECGAPERWTGPGEKGRQQGWYRHMLAYRNGVRCADRNACKNRINNQKESES